MASTIRKLALRLVSAMSSEGTQSSLVRRFSRPLADQLCGKVTDDFMELLLRGMELSFCLSKGYRENIRGFEGTYVFRTDDGKVGCTAVFHDGEMAVDSGVRTPYEVRVSFKDPKALWRFLLAENQDILDSILANEVEVDGNLNYIYRFGFLARDLQHRLGVA
ncbi:MAG: hypothetical protein LAO21_08860 [Acidobacteriia bacterium]|nr:hypothetical protein [Terriglobia bacterium]